MNNRPKSNFANPDIYPCKEEADLSQKCLEVQLYDYSKCTLFFDNYKQCKKFWGQVSKQRKAAGITPVIPTKAERDKILKLKKEGIITISCDEKDE